jgi:hypothetical protein
MIFPSSSCSPCVNSLLIASLKTTRAWKAGIIWFLQGINVLPGSFMTGQVQWAAYGGIAFLVGLGLLIVANRKKPSMPGNEGQPPRQ